MVLLTLDGTGITDMQELTNLPLQKMAEGIREKQFTSKALTRAFLDRIEASNPKLNAIINVAAEQAMKYAERADMALSGGETPGKLFGVPMTIKDSLDTFDLVSTWGTQGRAEFRPSKDATCVNRLREQGAILMGKSNTPEFTLSFKTDNVLFGKTRNPWDLERTPGGSSGGATAAIAAGLTPFDIGTDTGGSIRLPAHFSGICGLKPTTGRVPCTGNALPCSGLLARLTQPGPLARSVDDLTYLLDIISGPDNQDPNAISAFSGNPKNIDPQRLKVAYHTDNGISTPSAEIVSTIESVVSLLKEHRFTPTEARPTGLEMTGFLYGSLFTVDNSELAQTLIEDWGTTQPSADVAAILSSRRADVSGGEYSRAINLWHNYQSTMLAFFNDFDVLISPVNASTAIRHEDPEDSFSYTYTEAYNLTGWPGVVIRAGTDDQGLPIGIQILARPFREDHCLALAGYLEQRLGPFPDPDFS